jgi:hypothetical protein
MCRISSGIQAAKNASMKVRPNAAFSLIELMFVIGTVFLLLVIFPRVAAGTSRAKRIPCLSNQKQIGLAFRMWANEHAERFPMNLTAAEGGTKEMAFQGFPLSSFLIISNEISHPKPLTCPEDKKRKPATDFAQLTAGSLSYFLGLDSSESRPQSILTGDRNICINGQPTKGFVMITNWAAVSWDATIHNREGHIGLADGSAHQVTVNLFQKSLQATQLATNRFAVP